MFLMFPCLHGFAMFVCHVLLHISTWCNGASTHACHGCNAGSHWVVHQWSLDGHWMITVVFLSSPEVCTTSRESWRKAQQAQQAQHGEVSGSISPSWAPLGAPGLSFELSIVAVGANWAPELLPDLCEISAMLHCRLVQLLNPKALKKPWETTA